MTVPFFPQILTLWNSDKFLALFIVWLIISLNVYEGVAFFYSNTKLKAFIISFCILSIEFAHSFLNTAIQHTEWWSAIMYQTIYFDFPLSLRKYR